MPRHRGNREGKGHHRAIGFAQEHEVFQEIQDHEVRHRWLFAPHALVLHTEIHTRDLRRTACVECFHGHFTITFRVIVAFDVIRTEQRAGLLSCAVLLKDDRCAAVQPSSAAVDPVSVGIHSVPLHPTLLNNSSRSSNVAIEFSRTFWTWSNCSIFNESSPLLGSSSEPLPVNALVWPHRLLFLLSTCCKLAVFSPEVCHLPGFDVTLLHRPLPDGISAVAELLHC